MRPRHTVRLKADTTYWQVRLKAALVLFPLKAAVGGHQSRPDDEQQIEREHGADEQMEVLRPEREPATFHSVRQNGSRVNSSDSTKSSGSRCASRKRVVPVPDTGA